MGLFDLFKKLIKENKVKEIILEELTFSEIENWIENKIKENELKQNEIILMIKDKIKTYNEELKKKIKTLEDFDVDSKKEKDEIKNIVINSRAKYIESVEEFLESLNNLKRKEFEEFMSKINKIFLDFNKKSYKNYERATILIGKEMASIKEGVKIFSKDLLKTYEENKELVKFFKTIPQIKSKYQSIIQIDSTLNEIVEKKAFQNKKISEKEKENKLLNEKIEEIKKSKDYLDFLNIQKKIESLKSESKKDILELKQLLEFKSLTNFFHINQEQMKIIKNHKEDFYTHFIKDNGKTIINLLDEAKLNNEKIIKKIKDIDSKLKEIADYEQNPKKDKNKEISYQIKELCLEIDNLKTENIKEEKRNVKLKANKQELINSLKQELNKINVKVV